MADDHFRLPGSSYERVAAIIQAYGHFDGEVAVPELSKASTIDASEVSRNNAFLVGIEILEGAKQKGLTEKGRALARALNHSLEDEIRRHWRRIVSESDFLRKIVAAVRIRKRMDPSTVLSHIAYSAGAPKGNRTTVGAGTVVEILKIADVIREDAGQLVAVLEEPSQGTTEPLFTQAREKERQELTVNAGSGVATVPVPAVSFQIQIQVQCGPDDLEQLVPRLRQLLRELNRTSDES